MNKTQKDVWSTCGRTACAGLIPLLLISALLFLSACTLASSLPTQNVSPLLADKQVSEPAEGLEGKLTAADPSATVQSNASASATTETAAAKTAENKTEISPAVKNQLLPSASSGSPAAQAADAAATAPPAPDQTGKQSAEKQEAQPADGDTEKPAEVAALAPAESQATANSVGTRPATVRYGASRAEQNAAGTAGATRRSSGFSFFSRTNEAGDSPQQNTRVAARSDERGGVTVTTNRRERTASRTGNTGLPGVSLKTIFGVETEEEDEEMDEPVRVASLSNLARRGDHGLLLQRPGVQVGCFPPKLIGILRKVERKFGRAPVVTSGYRSPSHNRRVRGARKSTHMSCTAADIQVVGISKWTLAKYLRSLPERGGVGTYCHTKSVHIDIGAVRAWNRPCRTKRLRRKRG